MSNHPSIPNRYQGPKRTVSFAMGFGDPVMPAFSTPVHNGPSATVIYDQTETLEPKKAKKDDIAKSAQKTSDQPKTSTPTPSGKAR